MERCELVVGYASHKLSRTDTRKSPTKRECVVVLWGVDHFRMYLWGREFTLVTDCNALTWFFKSQKLSPKLHRWRLRLMEYNMEVKWRPRTSHHLPEALFRLPTRQEPGVDI